MDLYDPHPYPGSAQMMEETLLLETGITGLRSRASRGGKHGQPLWQEPTITPVERAAYAEWTLSPHAALLSAVMARIGILWRHWDNDTELTINPSTGSPQLSWWEGPSAESFAQFLTQSAIKVQGTRLRHYLRKPYIVLDDSSLELRGPGSVVEPTDR